MATPNAEDRDRWIPLSSRDLEFDMCIEMRRATVDLIRGNPPSNLLGLLMVKDEPFPINEAAEQLNKPVEKLEWVVEHLAEEDLCESFTKDGITWVLGFAAFSSRNSF